MSLDQNILEQKIPNDEILSNDDDNMNIKIMRETYNKFNSVTYSTEELNIFKDNILSLLKERDKFFLNRLSDYRYSTDKIKSEFNSQNKISNSKFSKIIETQAKMTSRLDQLSEYETFVTKTNEKLVSHEVRLTNIRNDFSLATQKYDKIYLDNLELPGYIGRCAKYKNCQVFFLDVIKDLAKLNIYKEKNIIDLKMYKDKLETIISSMNSILDNNNESQIKYINEMKEKILKDCKSMFESVSDNMKEIRVENSKYAVDLISTSMDLSKKWDKLEKIKEELLEKFNYDVNKYQMLTDDTIKSFEEFKTEYGVIRRKFMELAEFIKDVRFRKNIGGNVKKKEVKQMVKKILKKRKSFEGENVQLLSDITNIENIDYKKYYNFESDEVDANNENENNENNKSKSLKQKNKKNNIKEKEKIFERNRNKNNNSSPKEMKHKKEINQSVEESPKNRIKINTSSLGKPNNTEKEKDKNKSSRSVNMNVNISSSFNNKKIKSKEKNNNNTKNYNNNINRINVDEKNIKNNLVIDSKNLKDEDNYEQNKTLNKNKSKDSNIIKLVKNNSNNNIELRNILDDNNKSLEKKENLTMQYSSRSNKTEKENTINNNSININIAKVNYDNNKTKTDSKPSLIEDASTISEVKNSVNKENTNKFSSEKSVSFMSDSNGNNINKFLINDIRLEQNDRIIKELASELEQSTAKKDKFEQKFKTACNNIEPINLLTKKSDNNQNHNVPSSITKIEIHPKQIKNAKDIEYKYNKNNINSNVNVNEKENSNNMKIDNNQNNNINDINIKTPASMPENNNNVNNTNNNIKRINIINEIDNSNMNSNVNPNLEVNMNQNINPSMNINMNQNINSSMNTNMNSNINPNTNTNMNPSINSNMNTNMNTNMNSNMIPNINSNVNSNINSNMNQNVNSNMNPNMIKNESISNLNPIKINNEIHLNEVISNNSVNKKLHAFDQKLLNLELYTKEKIIELISQINSLKQNGNIQDKNNNSNVDISKSILMQNITPSSNEKYKTFNNSFINNQNQKLNTQSAFNVDKMYENISTNNENNKNALNINNNQSPNMLFINNNNSINSNLEKKRYSLRNLNGKQSLVNTKIQKKNSISYNLNTNNNIIKRVQNNVLTENNSNNININNNIINNNVNNNNCLSTLKNSMNSINNLNNTNNIIKQNNNTKEIIEGTGTKIIHNINNDINYKFLKDTEKKMDNNSILKVSNIDDLYNKKYNKSIYNSQGRGVFGDGSYNGAEIKLVDLNKLVNHQLPRNRLVPIHINENDYFGVSKVNNNCNK